jgi:type I restriction enzyme M protein
VKANGQAAVVLPDNILFEGGAGETVCKQLLRVTDLHTVLRLPAGIFYAHGVKANVLFFDNKPAAKTPRTKDIWIYDYRTNIHHTLKKRPLKLDDLREFIDLYRGDNRAKRKETWSEATPDGRWRKYGYDEIIGCDKTNLDVFWLRDESLTDLKNLPEPDVLAGAIIDGLEAALEGFRSKVAQFRQGHRAELEAALEGFRSVLEELG